MPILSVIIPTHNRSKYAIPTIRAMIALSPDIEVVVSDTSMVDEISAIRDDLEGRERFVLIRPPAGISVVDNFNIALQSATGEYLVFIGDDDLVTSQAVELARWAKARGIDSFSLTFPASYYWPDFIHQLRGNFYSGTVRIADFGNDVHMHAADRAMAAAAAQFGAGVLEMPRAYAGMLSRELADRIIAKHGALFGGVSPDIYSAALISDESRACVRIEFPIVVPGNSGASTAGQSASGGHVGKLRENAHIGAFKNLVWDPLIPEFYSVPTVWSYSLLKALEKIDKASQANFMRLYVRCLIFHRNYWVETRRCIAAYRRKVGTVRASLEFVWAVLAEVTGIIRKIFSMARVTVSGKPAPSLQNVPDTISASQLIEIELRRRQADKAFSQALADFPTTH
jgi:glycosyltransferase involved in cell wall biosynthesis